VPHCADLRSEMRRQITGRVEWLMNVTQLEQTSYLRLQQTRVVSAVRDRSQTVVGRGGAEHCR